MTCEAVEIAKAKQDKFSLLPSRVGPTIRRGVAILLAGAAITACGARGISSPDATVPVTSTPVVGIVTTFETFGAGAIDQQQDWQSYGGLGALPIGNPVITRCAVYDQVIADNTAPGATYAYPAFGTRSLRISNAVTRDCYTDQTFSSRTANPAGQAGARTTNANGSINYALPGGVLQNHFEAAWSFASATPEAQQQGLQVTVSPARGDDDCMSWVRLTDLSDGLAVIFGEWVSTVSGGTVATGAPLLTTVAHGLDRHVPHTILISMDFLPGPGNDVVRLYVDGVLVHTGTTWENYYAYDAVGLMTSGGAPPIVNRLLFRTGGDPARGIPGAPAPSTLGYGFVFDNLRQATFMIGSASDLLGEQRNYSDRAISATANEPRYSNAPAARSLLTSLESVMTKKHARLQSPQAELGLSPVPPTTEPHHDVKSPAFDHANDRMKLAAEPNDGEPLSHRDHGKAGRKG